MSAFRERYSLEHRQAESKRILIRHTGRVPIICERIGTDVPLLDKMKYLVPLELTIGQFLYVIRKRLVLSPEKALFFFINNILPCPSHLIGATYDEHKDPDGFLYIKYSGENTFGEF